MAYTYYPEKYQTPGASEPRAYGVSYARPYSVQGITTYGQPEYQEAMADYKTQYGTYSDIMKELKPKIKNILDYYKAGGGYGAGQRTEAKEAVQGGMATDIGQQVASGMSSQFGARGTATRAGSELSKLYKNIEDTRASLEMQATQPYMQVLQAVKDIISARPSYGEYVKPVVTTQSGYSWV